MIHPQVPCSVFFCLLLREPPLRLPELLCCAFTNAILILEHIVLVLSWQQQQRPRIFPLPSKYSLFASHSLPHIHLGSVREKGHRLRGNCSIAA